ncbi:hypothetical protein CNR22_12950 [Sphingobacteriaceae bacterium]|nr:hypothetical protein CNR22_12950 [Sphingobacteriaceae bacterium]
MTPTHNTPCFTGKKQFEGNIGLNLNGANLNLAYSPLNYLSLQVSGYSSLSSPFASVFNNQLEAGVGGYLPAKRTILGLTVGYGRGLTNWDRIWYSGDAYTPLENLQFRTEKYFIQHYAAYRWISHESFSGISGKINFMDNHYRKATYVYYEKVNYARQQFSYELTYFIKLKMTKKLYANFAWGMHFLNSDEAKSFDVHPIGQIGLNIKL